MFRITPNDFLTGNRCPKCSSKVVSKKLSSDTNTFKKKVYKLVGNEFSVIGRYINAHTNIRIKHNVCGYIFSTSPCHFLDRKKCPKCNLNLIKKKLSKSNSEYQKEFYTKINNKYTLLSKYHNANTKVLVRHNKCHYNYWVNPESILKGHGCPYCYGSNFVNDTIFKKRIKNLGHNHYITLTKYISTHTKVRFKHLTCGRYFWMMPSDFTSNGHRCPYCFGNKRKTTLEFMTEVKKLVDNEYSVLGNYKNGQHKILMSHNVCGYIYKTRPNNFLRGKRCPRCNESHGEHVIEHYLIKHHVKYVTQKCFTNCVYKEKLPFDFYLPDYHQLIEYDGYQHHNLMNYGGNMSKREQKQALELRIKRDNIKTDFCKNNFHLRELLRIPAPSRDPSINEVKKRVTTYLDKYFSNL